MKSKTCLSVLPLIPEGLTSLATPMAGAVGKEGQILPVTIPLGIAASLMVGLIVWMLIG
jgi:hypothetical protein